eukprot:g11676.t1
MLYYTILYYTILYYTILFYTILYYTILYYTILKKHLAYCITLHYNARARALMHQARQIKEIFFSREQRRIRGMTTPPASRLIIIEAGDGLKLSVESKIAFRCHAVKAMVQRQEFSNNDGTGVFFVFFNNVSGSSLAKVLDFCRYEWPDDPVEPSSDYVTFKEYLEGANPAMLCELASASYYLDVKPLVDLTCRAIADTIKGKSPEEIRSTFNIVNDFTPQEEEQVRRSVLERTLLLPGEECSSQYSHTNNTRNKLRSKLGAPHAGSDPVARPESNSDDRSVDELMNFINKDEKTSAKDGANSKNKKKKAKKRAKKALAAAAAGKDGNKPAEKSEQTETDDQEQEDAEDDTERIRDEEDDDDGLKEDQTEKESKGEDDEVERFRRLLEGIDDDGGDDATPGLRKAVLDPRVMSNLGSFVGKKSGRAGGHPIGQDSLSGPSGPKANGTGIGGTCTCERGRNKGQGQQHCARCGKRTAATTTAPAGYNVELSKERTEDAKDNSVRSCARCKDLADKFEQLDARLRAMQEQLSQSEKRWREEQTKRAELEEYVWGDARTALSTDGGVSLRARSLQCETRLKDLLRSRSDYEKRVERRLAALESVVVSTPTHPGSGPSPSTVAPSAVRSPQVPPGHMPPGSHGPVGSSVGGINNMMRSNAVVGSGLPSGPRAVGPVGERVGGPGTGHTPLSGPPGHMGLGGTSTLSLLSSLYQHPQRKS